MLHRALLAIILTCLASTAMAGDHHYCHLSDHEYFGITVHNRTDVAMQLDMGDPSYGFVDFDPEKKGASQDDGRVLTVHAHATVQGVVCSGPVLTRLEAHVSLFDKGDLSGVAQWHVTQAPNAVNTVQLTRTPNFVFVCQMQYYTQWWDSKHALHSSTWKEEPSVFRNHSHINQVVVWCRPGYQ